MKRRLRQFLSRRSVARSVIAPAPGTQPGLWSPPPGNVAFGGKPDSAPSTSSPAPLSGHNPFASVHSSAPGGRTGARYWLGWLRWFDWRSRSGARRRLFSNVEQLELVLGRPRMPVRNHPLEEGQPVQTRRSGPAAGGSKVIYESPPAVAVDATRMMEESDRAYERLRGRRLETMRVTPD